MTIRNLAAIDLGASSGRVMLARWDADRQKLTLNEIHRFTNGFKQVAGHDCWDLDRLEREILTGLTLLDNDSCRLDGIGIDTWGWIMFCWTSRASGLARRFPTATIERTG